MRWTWPGSAAWILSAAALLVELIGPRRMLASQRFDVREAAVGTAPAQVVAAFGLDSDRLSAQVLDWTLAQDSRRTELSARD